MAQDSDRSLEYHRHMKNVPVDIPALRREQIIEAAVAVIAEQGIQNLSLSEIEKKADMSRGQLTYYFPAKEEILLAVFDRVLQLMYQRMGTPEGTEQVPCDQQTGWDWIQHLFKTIFLKPPVAPEFGCLQYTFLSQVGHREDFRRRLASLYEEWRGNMTRGLTIDLGKQGAGRKVSPRALATLVQAILHGLGMQAAADPQAFDRQEMVDLCLDVLGSYLREKRTPRQQRTTNKRPKRTRSVTARQV
jgi:AcrR family transcriptional regulator